MAGDAPDLDAITATWLQVCGRCDVDVCGAACICSTDDPRPVIAALVREVERLRAELVREVARLQAEMDGPE